MQNNDRLKYPMSTQQQSPASTLPRFLVPMLLLIGFLVRLLVTPNPGFEADITFWKSWGLAPFDHGLVWSMYNTNNNYPTPFAYLLWILTTCYSFFLDPHVFNQYWTDTNVVFLFFAKLPSILADMGIVGLILWIGKSPKRFGFPGLSDRFYVLLAMLYLFSPLSILDGALWGQVDSLGVVIYLAACLLAFRKKPFLAGLVYMLGLMTKLQNMIYGPLLFLFIWQDMGWTGLVKAAAGAMCSFVGLNIEFLAAKKTEKIWASLTDNYDYFPLMSLNAYNLWWIVAKGNGMHISDKLSSIGMLTAKTTGLYLFIAGYLLSVLTMVKNTLLAMWQNKPIGDDEPDTVREERIGNFMIALVIAAAAFFLFQTESHDRYAFPISIFYLMMMPFVVADSLTEKLKTVWWKTSVYRYMLVGYGIFTLVYFLNLHTALIDNYPQNGIAWLLFLKSPIYTIPLAVIQLILFTAFIIGIRSRIWLSSIAASILCFIVLITAGNLPLIMRKPVALSKLTPFISMQDFGTRVHDMPVNASGGSKTWDRLSVQYMFYRFGIGTHAKSYIAYDINGNFSRFTTDIGIDTEAGEKGTAVFEIYGDDKLLYQSKTAKRYEFPQHADISIKGVKKLGLVVQDGGDGINDDHADWLNAKLWP
jgi:Gpi18-like mannosyltransferase